MLCLAAWCGLHKQAKKGNTMVFSKLGGKFLGWIQVDQSDNIMDVQTKASKLLPHPLFCHPAYLVVYDATNKRLSPRQTFLITTLKKSACNQVVDIPCVIQVAWDEDVVQQDVGNIQSDLPTTTFDGHKITTIVSSYTRHVTLPESIELYSLARSFSCCASQTTVVDAFWLKLLCDLEKVELTNCIVHHVFNVVNVRIPRCIKHLSIVSQFCEIHMKLDGISSYQSLKVLRLQGTLYGSIPDEVSDLKSLTTLDLAYNKLGGDVRLGGLVNLEELFLQHNNLCGRLCVATCTKLRRLNVSHNKFEATVLDDINLCESLQEVDTSNNLF
jgi:hypothetical protein